MLVLTRKKGQSVLIGNDIEVTVLGVGTNKVRLGFSGPRQISVRRNEIAHRFDNTVTHGTRQHVRN